MAGSRKFIDGRREAGDEEAATRQTACVRRFDEIRNGTMTGGRTELHRLGERPVVRHSAASPLPKLLNYRDLDVWKRRRGPRGRRVRAHTRVPAAQALRPDRSDPPRGVVRPGEHRRGRRSAISEGEYAHHVSIARGSVSELVTLLEIAQLLGYATPARVAPLLKRAEDIRSDATDVDARPGKAAIDGDLAAPLTASQITAPPLIPVARRPAVYQSSTPGWPAYAIPSRIPPPWTSHA